MSFIQLADVKRALRVIHSFDDILLQTLIDDAEGEALLFMNRTQLPTLPVDYPETASSEQIPSSEDPVAPGVFTAICCLVKADYEAPVGEIAALRSAAETKLQPFRIGLGV